MRVFFIRKSNRGWNRGMGAKIEVQHVYLVDAKSLGAYGGYETFVYKLTEYHQNKKILNTMLPVRPMAMAVWMKTSLRV